MHALIETGRKCNKMLSLLLSMLSSKCKNLNFDFEEDFTLTMPQEFIIFKCALFELHMTTYLLWLPTYFQVYSLWVAHDILNYRINIKQYNMHLSWCTTYKIMSSNLIYNIMTDKCSEEPRNKVHRLMFGHTSNNNIIFIFITLIWLISDFLCFESFFLQNLLRN